MGTKTTKLKNGTRVTRLVATTPEWKLQAAQVRRLRALPEYGRAFLLVGGMEAGRRGPQTATIAKATGLTAGHPDITIFLTGARCAFIENKTTKGRLSPVQKDWHEMLRRLGCVVEVIVAANENEAADKAEGFVRGLLAANDNAATPRLAKAVERYGKTVSTKSCGCIFCDIGLVPVNGVHDEGNGVRLCSLGANDNQPMVAGVKEEK